MDLSRFQSLTNNAYTGPRIGGPDDDFASSKRVSESDINVTNSEAPALKINIPLPKSSAEPSIYTLP